MEPTGAGSETKALGSVVQIDEGKIQAHLDEVVRSTVEETLNALLDAEADQLCGARKYERSESPSSNQHVVVVLLGVCMFMPYQMARYLFKVPVCRASG
jgi:hypothetical protein